MALRWMEGFEADRSQNHHDKKYALATGVASYVSGRLHGFAVQGSAQFLRTPSLTLQNTWVVGFAVFINVSTLQDTKIRFMTGTTEQVRLVLDHQDSSNFLVNLEHETNGVIDTAGDFAYGIWHYFEIKVTVHPTAGAYELRHNESTVFSGSGVDTADDGTAGADLFEFDKNGGAAERWDDIYILDSTGSVNNDFLGDSVVEAISPTSDGNQLDWTPSSGTTHYVLVDDVATGGGSADEATNVQSDTNADIDLWGFSDIAFITGTIHGIMVLTQAAMDIAGTRTIRVRYRADSTSEYTGGNLVVNDVNYKTFTTIFEQDPDAGPGAWQNSALDAAEFGVEVVS